MLHTTNHCLHIKSSTNLDITGFSDANQDTNIDDKKSMVGQCVFLCEILISWSSRKQQVVSRSNAEPEYRALAELLIPLLRKPVLLWCDNLSAKALVFIQFCMFVLSILKLIFVISEIQYYEIKLLSFMSQHLIKLYIVSPSH